MEYIPVPNVAQVELVYNWKGQVCQTVLHYTTGATYTQALLNTLALEVITVWKAQMPVVMPTDLSLIQVRAIDLSSQSGPVVNQATGLPAAGTMAGTSLPNNCACVFTKRTALRGRSFRGRIYHPGLTTGQVTGNALTVGALGGILLKYNNFLDITDQLANHHLLGVISRYENKLPRDTGIFTQVLNFTSDGVVDSQRRRLPGRGA